MRHTRGIERLGHALGRLFEAGPAERLKAPPFEAPCLHSRGYPAHLESLSCGVRKSIAALLACTTKEEAGVRVHVGMLPQEGWSSHPLKGAANPVRLGGQIAVLA